MMFFQVNPIGPPSLTIMEVGRKPLILVEQWNCVLVSSVAGRRHLRSADTRSWSFGEHELLLELEPELSLSPALSTGTRYLHLYRSASLVTVCGNVCQTPESLLVSSPELAHLRIKITGREYCLFCAI